MARRHKKPGPQAARKKTSTGGEAGVDLLYEHACHLACQGQNADASRIDDILRKTVSETRLPALIANDRAVLAAQAGAFTAAHLGFREALQLDPNCDAARANLALLEEDIPGVAQQPAVEGQIIVPSSRATSAEAVKVAIVSFLFNWSSTGGGIVHTVELAQFMIRSGLQVHHFYARFDPWGFGRVEHPPPFPSEVLAFDDAGWNLPAIQDTSRQSPLTAVSG